MGKNWGRIWKALLLITQVGVAGIIAMNFGSVMPISLSFEHYAFYLLRGVQ